MKLRYAVPVMSLFAMALALLPGLVSVAVAKESVKEALTGGKVNVDLRYRYEFVDQENFVEDARASTLRLRLGYTTGLYYGVFAMAEFDGIWVVGSEMYNSSANGLTQYPLVADPEGEELNQGFLGYKALDMMTFKLGRQRIKLDNDRFVGNVGWRQNEQTYDAFSGWFDFNDEFSLLVGYIDNTNRIFGEDHPDQARADLNTDAPLLNISYDFPVGKLTGYSYFLDLVAEPMTSNKSIGARFIGAHAFTDKVKLLYTGEYADQSPWRDGAATNNAEYGFAELGVGIKAVTLKAGYELLGGDGVYSFQTPLATGHAFNGWADVFLITPLNGLADTYFSAAVDVKGIKLLGVYHSFSPDTGSGDYGTEIDLQITKGFYKMYSVGAKYASYSADSSIPGFPVPGLPGLQLPQAVRPNVDVEKVWVWLGLKY